MRRTTSLTALLLGATLLIPTGHASAAGETCRGEAATIVGTGKTIQGTEGRDVIVSDGATTVLANGGDDLICLMGAAKGFSIDVDAGTGNDVVDASATQVEQTYVDLGAGADSFLGGTSWDDVQASGYDTATGAEIPDNDRDIIDTGAGADRIASFTTDIPNPDVLTAGPGTDSVYVEGPLAADGQVDAGGGVDELRLATVDSGALSVNAATGTATLAGADWMRWSGFDLIDLSLRRVDLAYIGSDQDDSLHVLGYEGDPSVAATLNGGDDHITLEAIRPFGTIDADGGDGSDTVEVVATVPVAADLSNDTLTWDALTHTIGAFENVSAVGSVVGLIGDNGRNVLEGGPCVARIQGGGGKDSLLRRGEPAGEPIGVDCARSKAVFNGGSGNDRLDGSRYGDVLRGGPGNDRIIGRKGRDTGVGGPGRDRCSTEIRRSCER